MRRQAVQLRREVWVSRIDRARCRSHPERADRAKLDAGLLPRVQPEKMWTRYGDGNFCDGCGDPIHPAQVKYEFRIKRNSDDVFRFHIGCLGMWLAELRRRAS
jgi:hypothetical protein